MAEPGSPKVGELRAAMSEILQSSELAQLTARIVRSKLEDKFGVSLVDRKKSLDIMLMEMIEEEQANSEDDEDDEDNNEQIAKAKDDERSKKNSIDSNAEEETEELDDQPSPKKQKIQAPNSTQPEEETDQNVQQSDSDEADVNDEELAWKLQKNERSLRTRRQIRKPQERKIAKSKKNGGEKKADRKGTGFGKPMLLSEKLAAVVGVNRMSRSDVVKKMWEIIKERKLEDPRNKRYTICDEELASLFGRKKIQTFGMMKYLKKHIKDPELIV